MGKGAEYFVNCAICGKELSSINYNFSEYAYVKDDRYFCSWAHLQEYKRERERVRRQFTWEKRDYGWYCHKLRASYYVRMIRVGVWKAKCKFADRSIEFSPYMSRGQCFQWCVNHYRDEVMFELDER